MLVYSPAPGLGRLGALPTAPTACVQAPCNGATEAAPPIQTLVLPPPTAAVTAPPVMCIKAPCDAGTIPTVPPSTQQVDTKTAQPPAPVPANALPTTVPSSSVGPATIANQPIPYAKILAGVGVLFLGFSAVKFLSR